MPEITPIGLSINSDPAKKGADEFTKALDNVDKKTAETKGFIDLLDGALSRFGGVFAIVTAGLGVKNLIDAADGFTLLKTRLDASTGSAEKGTEALGYIRTAAESAHVSVKALAQAYSDGSRVLQEKGMTIAESVQAFELMAKMLRLSGNSAEDAEQGMDAFARGVNNGRLAVRQFEELLAKTPDLARILQRELGATSADLRKMAEAGMISGNTIAVALRKNADEINSKFKSVPRTVGEAWDELTGKLSKIGVGAYIESGVSRPLIEVIDWARKVSVEVSSLAKDFVKATGDFVPFTDALRLVGSAMAIVTRATLNLWQELRHIDEYFTGLMQKIRETSGWQAMSKAIESVGDKVAWLRDKLGLEDKAKAAGEALSTAARNAADNWGTLGAGLAGIAADVRETGAAVLGHVVAWEKVVGVLEQARVKTAEVRNTNVAASLEKSQYNDMAKKILEAETAQADVLRAQLGTSKYALLEAQEELEVRTKIPVEVRKYEAAMAKQIEDQIRLNNNIKMQAANLAETRTAGEGFATTVTDGFLSGAKAGDSFGTSVRKVTASLAEMLLKMVVLEPMVKGFGRSFADMLPNFNPSKIDATMNGGDGKSMFSGIANSGASAEFTTAVTTAATTFGTATETAATGFSTLVDTAGTTFGLATDTAGTGFATILETAAAAFGAAIEAAGASFAATTGASGGASEIASALPFFAFAEGDVFSSPVKMRTSGGANAVMAEAGPEAVMPLQRGADGRLGVAVNGGSGGQQAGHTVIMNVAGDVSQETVNRLMSGVHTAIASAAPGIVAASVNRVAALNRANPGYMAR